MNVSKIFSVVVLLGIAVSGCDESLPTEDEEEPGGITISYEMPDDDGVIRTVEESDSLLDEDELYSTGQLEKPEYIFLDNGTVKSFALVWLPEGWSTLPSSERKAIVHLHGHCGLAAMHFSTWHILAEPRNMAVIAPQVWLDDDSPPSGYSTHPDGGFHLDTDNDIFPFTDTLLKYFGASSAMIHGFSMFACASVVLTYRDKNRDNLYDFTVFDAGHIAESHPFREEIEAEAAASGDSTQFSGEHFFFFIETESNYANQLDTRDFVRDFGGDVVETFESPGYHGIFYAPIYEGLRESIVVYYDSLSQEP